MYNVIAVLNSHLGTYHLCYTLSPHVRQSHCTNNHTPVTPLFLVTTPTQHQHISQYLVYYYSTTPSRKHPTKPPESLPLPYSLPRYQPNTIPRSQAARPHQRTAPPGPLTSSSRIAQNASHARVYVLEKRRTATKHSGTPSLRLKKGEKRKPQAGPPPMLSAQTLCLKSRWSTKMAKEKKGPDNKQGDVQERSGKGWDMALICLGCDPFP
jgi:hypothetical protein